MDGPFTFTVVAQGCAGDVAFGVTLPRRPATVADLRRAVVRELLRQGCAPGRWLRAWVRDPGHGRDVWLTSPSQLRAGGTLRLAETAEPRAAPPPRGASAPPPAPRGGGVSPTARRREIAELRRLVDEQPWRIVRLQEAAGADVADEWHRPTAGASPTSGSPPARPAPPLPSPPVSPCACEDNRDALSLATLRSILADRRARGDFLEERLSVWSVTPHTGDDVGGGVAASLSLPPPASPQLDPQPWRWDSVSLTATCGSTWSSPVASAATAAGWRGSAAAAASPLARCALASLQSAAPAAAGSGAGRGKTHPPLSPPPPAVPRQRRRRMRLSPRPPRLQLRLGATATVSPPPPGSPSTPPSAPPSPLRTEQPAALRVRVTRAAGWVVRTLASCLLVSAAAEALLRLDAAAGVPPFAVVFAASALHSAAPARAAALLRSLLRGASAAAVFVAIGAMGVCCVLDLLVDLLADLLDWR